MVHNVDLSVTVNAEYIMAIFFTLLSSRKMIATLKKIVDMRG